MKKKLAFLLAVVMLITGTFAYSATPAQAGDDVLDLEAENGRIYYGKVLGESVVIGDGQPQGETSGILWWADSTAAQNSTLTIYYTAQQDAQVYVHWGAAGQSVTLSANQTSLQVPITLASGTNLIQLLFQTGGAVTLDKVTLGGAGLTETTEAPTEVSPTQKFYFSRNARIFMGKVDSATDSVSGTCVTGLTYNSGQGIKTSAHVAFTNVYAETDSLYQLIVFTAADAGSNVEICVNGQSYVVPVYLPQGKGAFTNPAGERSHAVLECALKAGNNEVLVRGADNTDVRFDMLSAQFLREITEAYTIEAENGRIYFGKVLENAVTIGEEVPAQETSGILWWIDSSIAQNTYVAIHYEAEQDAQVLVHWGSGYQFVTLPAGKHIRYVNASLAAGQTLFQVLYQSGGAVTIDKLALDVTGAALHKWEPTIASETEKMYFARDAKIFMGKVAGALNSVSQECVAGLTYTGNSIKDSSHVAFTNVYSEKDSIYQLLIFCAAEAGQNIEVNVNGKSYVVPVLSPLGKDVFLETGTGARSHAVVAECRLKAGNNEIIVRGEGNADVKIDTLHTTYLREVPLGPETESFEAENGRIYYGKIVDNTALESKKEVVIGQDVPQGETSGVLWWVNADGAKETLLTIHYSTEQDAQVYLHWGPTGEQVILPAGQTTQQILITLAEGENVIQLLHQGSQAVAIDRITMNVEGLAEVKEEPLPVSDTQKFYFSRNASIFMGKVDAAADSVSTTCVSGLTYSGSNGITDSAHVGFHNVNTEKAGIYELIVFCAADAGKKVEICVNGISYTVPILIPLGYGAFTNPAGERSHAVVKCELKEGNNQVLVRGAENAPVRIDMLSVRYLSEIPVENKNLYEAENAELIDVVKKGEGQEYNYGTYSGTGFVGNIDTGSSEVRFKVNAPEEGEYELKIRYASGAEGYVPTFRVFTAEGYYGEVELPNITGWGNFCTATISTIKVSLRAGENTIIIKNGKHNAELDYIELGAKVGNYKDPLDRKSGYTRYEAEDAKISDVVKKGKGQEYDYGSYSGTGFIGNIDTGSSEIRFKVNVAKDGEYELNICYASGAEGYLPTFRVFTGEGFYGEVELKNITGWGNFGLNTIASTKISLRAGDNEIIIKNGKHNAELDYIEVGPRTGNYKDPLDRRSGYTRFEAEDAEISYALKKGKGQEYDYGTYSGTGFVGSIDTDSSEVRFRVSVAEDGEYELCVCYSTGAEGVVPTFHVFTQEGYYGQIELPNVTGWGNFGLDTIATMKISLKAGENVITIRKAMHNAELDFIEIGPRVGSYKEPIQEEDNSLEFELVDNNFKNLEVVKTEIKKAFPFGIVAWIAGGIVLVGAIVTGTIVFVKKRKKDEINEK